MTQLSNVGAEVDLQLRQGADFIATLSFAHADGTPLDLTGCTLRAQLRKGALDAKPAATFAFVMASPPSGVAIMTLSALDSAALPCGEDITDIASQYVWDLELDQADGTTLSPLYGNVTVFREVTR